MPQGQQQRQPANVMSFEELLEQERRTQPMPTPTPTPALSFEQMLEQERQAGPTFEQMLEQATQPQEGYYESLRRNLGLGLEMLGQKVSDVVMSGAEIAGGVATGDFRPLLETGEMVGRGALTLASAFDPAGNAYEPTVAEQVPAIAAVKERQTARREASGDIYFRGSAIENARLQAEAAKDPSLFGRAVRTAPQVLPYVLTGIVSGGSVPALAATGAALELDQPEKIPLSAGLAAVPVPVGQAARAGFGAIRQILGRGGAQVVEAAAASSPRGIVTGAVEDMARLRAQASPALQAAIVEGAEELPRSLAQRVWSEVSAVLQLPRAFMASADISAPLRQGALLTVPPSQWGRAAQASVKMFESFSTRRYNKIVEEIAAHPDSQLAQASGLHLSTQAKQALRKGEEDFISKYASRIPIVKHSEQAYTAYLDSLRISTFAKYKRVIDAQGFAPAQAERAYRAAADWINIASGRGSLGKTIDKAMEPLSTILFAPRYAASRVNVLNPMMYVRNAATPEGRVILRQQMGELFQYAGAVASTMALAKAAGADVSLDPNSADFLKIRFGRYRYDSLAGLQQVMRLIYRTGADISRAVRGEKSLQGENALDVGGRFLRSKLAPIPSYFVDFVSRRTYTGRPIAPVKDALDRITPIMWQDWIDAYQAEGWKGVAMVTPGIAGVGVQAYDPDPIDAALDRLRPLLSEYIRLGREVPELRPAQNEADEAFKIRTRVYAEALEKYGLGLVASDQYKGVSDETKRKALDLLSRRISTALIKQGEAWLLSPGQILEDVRDSQERKREAERERQRQMQER